MEQPATTPDQDVPSPLQEVFEFSKRFAELLILGEYAEARELLTEEEKVLWRPTALAHNWVRMVENPPTARMIPETIAVDAMEDWLEKRPGDMGWLYVPIVSEHASEAISGVAVSTPQGPRLRALLFGRP